MDYDRFAVLITFPDGYSGTGFLVLQTLAQFVIAYFGVLCLFLRMAKICVICSQDCSNEPRFKDEDGHYVCASCYETQDDTEATTTNFTVGEKAAGIAVLLIIIVICGSVIWRFYYEDLGLYFAILVVALSLVAFANWFLVFLHGRIGTERMHKISDIVMEVFGWIMFFTTFFMGIHGIWKGLSGHLVDLLFYSIMLTLGLSCLYDRLKTGYWPEVSRGGSGAIGGGCGSSCGGGCGGGG